MNIDSTFFQSFLSGLSDMLGDKFEIVVHDFSKGFDHTVVQIINSMTGRLPGDSPTNLFFERMQVEGMKLKDFPTYYIDMPDGRKLKAFATFIRDKDGNAIGAVCVKMDITGLLQISNAAASYIGNGFHYGSELFPQQEVYAHSLDELMDYYLNQVELNAGKDPVTMTKAEKMEALDYLDRKGVLHMSKANVRLCEFFGFSKFTLYNYLDVIREQRTQEDQ